jgi:hypothetical protein
MSLILFTVANRCVLRYTKLMAPPQSPTGRRAQHLCLAVGAILSLASCGHAAIPTSRYAFETAPELVGYADVAWFAVADAATRTYGELAMVNFAIRQIGWEVLATSDAEARVSPGRIAFPRAACVADSQLLYVFAGICSNILGRNELDAADKAAAVLRKLCY